MSFNENEINLLEVFKSERNEDLEIRNKKIRIINLK